MFIFTEICCHRLLLLEGLLMLTVLYTSQSISQASRENVASSTRSSHCHGGSSSDAMALALLLSWSLWMVCLESSCHRLFCGSAAALPGQWHRVQGECCLLRLCCSSPVDACYAVACFPSQTSVGRTCCVSPEL